MDILSVPSAEPRDFGLVVSPVVENENGLLLDILNVYLIVGDDDFPGFVGQNAVGVGFQGNASVFAGKQVGGVARGQNVDLKQLGLGCFFTGGQACE